MRDDPDVSVPMFQSEQVGTGGRETKDGKDKEQKARVRDEKNRDDSDYGFIVRHGGDSLCPDLAGDAGKVGV